jgi:predicted amidohydrolase YtcJ
MRSLFSAILISGLLLSTACRAGRAGSAIPPATVDPQQQIIFHNGTILTMDETVPQVQAVAISGQMIRIVGDNETVLAQRRPETRVIDLQGHTLIPGFVDAHSHLFNDAEQYFEMSLSEVQQLALENGITTIGDMYVNQGFLRQIQEFDQQGLLRIRTSLYLVATDNCGRLQGDWYLDFPPTRRPGEMLRLGGVKIFADGGTCQRPALSYELRPGEGLGDLFFSQSKLDQLVREAQAAGYQVAIHAIGDRAVEQAQNAIAAALDGGSNVYRHRIEHNSVIRPELLPRYGEIGIVPVIFGLYPLCNPFGPPSPPEYRAWEWPYRDLLEANPGLPVAWHGDDPFFGRVRPLDDLYSLVTRVEIDAEGQVCQPPDWLAEQTISAADALPMMTRHAAYAMFREEEVGSLRPGKYADLIVLSGDPLSVSPETLPDLEVWLTMVGGRVEYCSPKQGWLCP